MKYLIPVMATGAAIIAAVTTAVAQAHGVFTGQSALKPYLYGYAASVAMLAIAAVLALSAHKQERKDSNKEVNRNLAALIKEESELRESIRYCPNDATFTQLIRKLDEWVNAVFVLLNESVRETDAETFRQVGYEKLTPEYLSNFAHIPEWKRDVIARQLRYRQTLDQIMSNRRL
jgi:hypothetical protein